MLATIDSDIQNVTITEEENANFTCNFSEGDVPSTVYWTVGGREYDCVTTEEDIGADSNGCYTTEAQSVLLIRDTSSFTPNSTYTVQCILQHDIPQEFYVYTCTCDRVTLTVISISPSRVTSRACAQSHCHVCAPVE